MKKDDNTTIYSARLVCEECGYVFGLKEVACIEYGFSEPWNEHKIETKCYNEIYPKFCPKCKREAQHISYGIKLGVYCSPNKEQADIAIKKRKEEELRKGVEELRKINNFKASMLNCDSRVVSREDMTKILSYCNADIAFTECCKDAPLCWDCEAIKDYCSIWNCKHKDSVSPKYFEKNGLYPCAVFKSLKNASNFAEYMLNIIDLCANTDDKISLTYALNAIDFYNGYTRLHKSAENYSVSMPTTNEARCGWIKEELQTYGIAIDFEENKLTGRIYCIYLPVPKYFGGKKEDSDE